MSARGKGNTMLRTHASCLRVTAEKSEPRRAPRLPRTPCRDGSWPLAWLLACCLAPVVALAGAPTDQIKQTTDKILAVVQDPALQGADTGDARQKQMRKAIDERFDWAVMARSAFGKTWKDLTEPQRTEFTELFGNLVNKNYMSRVDSYSGEKIIYKSEKVEGLYGVVEVVIITLRGTDIPVSYRVLLKDANWLVYDISIEGVSMVNNYRSQIGAILNGSSYDNLISRIRGKIAAKPTEKPETKAGPTKAPKPAEGAL